MDRPTVIELTPGTALDFFETLFRGKHHIPGDVRCDGPGVFSVGMHVGHMGIATFDNDELTRFVLLAHARAVRGKITPGQPGCLRLWIAAREHGTDWMAFHHPSIDEAVAKFKEHDEMSWSRLLSDARVAAAPKSELKK